MFSKNKNGICPICESICTITNRGKASEPFQEYYCEKCGNFALPMIVSLLLSNDKQISFLKQYHPSIDKFDKVRLLNVIKNSIAHNRRSMKTKFKMLWFYLEEQNIEDISSISDYFLCSLHTLYYEQYNRK